MKSHIGVGIGKYIEEEFSKARLSIMISSPVISTKFAENLMALSEKGIKIKIITSPRVTEYSERANMMLTKFSNKKNSNQTEKKLDLKIIDPKKFSMNHAKMYIIDNKIAIIGSVNFSESYFWNNIEYLLILDESEIVNQVINDYDKLWNSYSYVTIDTNEKTVQTKNFIRKIRRKL